jgi:hypothetical protein
MIYGYARVSTDGQSHVPGRKTDVSDAQWLQRLHSYGLLRASFRPKGQIVELRAYVRQRERLLEYAASHIQHMQKALTEMNLQLHHVVADITGATGRHRPCGCDHRSAHDPDGRLARRQHHWIRRRVAVGQSRQRAVDETGDLGRVSVMNKANDLVAPDYAQEAGPIERPGGRGADGLGAVIGWRPHQHRRQPSGTVVPSRIPRADDY